LIPEGKKAITHKEYIKSKHWRTLSKSLLDDPDVICCICQRPRWGVWARGSIKKKKKPGDKKRLLMFNLHHVRYDRIGTPAEVHDILPICSGCHSRAHDLARVTKGATIWKKLYGILCDETVWEFTKAEHYLVPEDFVLVKKRVKKVKKK